MDNYAENERRVRVELKNAFSDCVLSVEGWEGEWEPRQKLLETAFTDQPYNELQLDGYHGLDEEYYQDIKFYLWYFDLASFPTGALPYIISHLMVSLLNEYPGETKMLVSFLNVPTVFPHTKQDAIEQLGYSKSVNEDYARFKENRLPSFSLDQIQAMIDWFLLARTWGELEDDRAEVDSAIHYWRAVAKRP